MEIRTIREFFWPLLEEDKKDKGNSKEDLPNPQEITDKKLLLEYLFKVYREEAERNKAVETKSLIFISITAVIVSILTGTMVTREISILAKIIAFILVIYLLRTLWFAIQALQRRKYHVLYYEKAWLKSGYLKNDIITDMVECITRNSEIINSKVDSMTLAQEYFKRAIVSIFIFALAIFIQHLPNISSATEINLLLITKIICLIIAIILLLSSLLLLFILGHKSLVIFYDWSKKIKMCLSPKTGRHKSNYQK